MPVIAEISTTKDGRPCVVLELSGDEGAVSLYTPEEIEALLRREREECARIAEAQVSTDTDWDTSYWNQCAEMIALKIRANV